MESNQLEIIGRLLGASHSIPCVIRYALPLPSLTRGEWDCRRLRQSANSRDISNMPGNVALELDAMR